MMMIYVHTCIHKKYGKEMLGVSGNLHVSKTSKQKGDLFIRAGRKLVDTIQIM